VKQNHRCNGVSATNGDRSKAENQQKIAALAYEFWLERGFRDGSPEEDLLRALCAFPEVQLSSPHTING
jgi:hypothetical protein